MEDSDIISKLFERSENALDELSLKYGKLMLHISRNILDSEQDAEECLNYAYYKIWQTIPPNRPDSLKLYCSRIIRNISLDRYRHDHAQCRDTSANVCLDDIQDILFDGADFVEEITEKEITKYIDDFLSLLADEERLIIVRHYWYNESYKYIADKLKIKEANVRKRSSNILKKLKKFLKSNGVIK